MNAVILYGMVVSDPRFFASDGQKSAMLTFRMVSSKRSDDKGKVFVGVKCYGHVAEQAQAVVANGTTLVVSGELRSESYESKGQKINGLCVVAREISADAPRRPREEVDHEETEAWDFV